MTELDLDALRARYAAEREKRLRPDGIRQYVRMEGRLARYLEDPAAAVAPRAPVRDRVEVVVVGAGFAGLLTAARLREAGVADVRLIDKGGDVGGTWYWNQYPGAQCDTTSFVYLPLLEETGHVPSEKYAHGPEILEHCRRIARHYGLYEGALLHTEVLGLRWDADDASWRVTTSRGDDLRARFVVLGTGPLHVPKLPGIEGLEDFRGHAFHTSRWDYAYTGGDARGAPMDRLGDQRVALIGTGATAVQCVPPLARACEALYVFQRTPSSVDVRGNVPTDPGWFDAMAHPGWQHEWMLNFAQNQTGAATDVDLVQDGWTDIARRIREKVAQLPEDERTIDAMLAAYEQSDYEKMDEIRARVDDVVSDPVTAASLKAWYRQLCKRPCFHDEYLQAFNEPGTVLVDTDGRGVERISEHEVWAGGVPYEVDAIVFATGFEVGTPYGRRAGFDAVGRDGLALSSHWSAGVRTLHGIHVHGFPNCFFVQLAHGGGLISNVPHNFAESAATIAAVVAHARAVGAEEVEATASAEAAWTDRVRGAVSILGTADCTPGYYNLEGAAAAEEDGTGRYPAGAVAFFALLDDWRRSGAFEGLEFRSDHGAEGAMSQEVAMEMVTESRTIDATPQAIFAILSSPRRHQDFDGTGMLRGSDSPDLTAVGDEFFMKMYYEQFGDYVMRNEVVELEPDRRIAWAPERHDSPDEDEERWFHRWGFELRPADGGGTVVTEFYDLSRSPESATKILRGGEVWRPGMARSLELLDELATGG